MIVDLCAAAAVRIHAVLQHAPTNLLLNWLRQRPHLRCGILFMLLGVAYLAAGLGLHLWIEAGAPDWLYLPAILVFWNGLKFLAFGPVSLVLLARCRIREHIERRRTAKGLALANAAPLQG